MPFLFGFGTEVSFLLFDADPIGDVREHSLDAFELLAGDRSGFGVFKLVDHESDCQPEIAAVSIMAKLFAAFQSAVLNDVRNSDRLKRVVATWP